MEESGGMVAVMGWVWVSTSSRILKGFKAGAASQLRRPKGGGQREAGLYKQRDSPGIPRGPGAGGLYKPAPL